MGNTNSNATKKRTLSIHSGSLYAPRSPNSPQLSPPLPPNSPMYSLRSPSSPAYSPRSPNSPPFKQTKLERSVSNSNSGIARPRHFLNSSADFNKSTSELKENLPDDLKAYSDSIEVMYRFWCEEIETLGSESFKETAVLFYLTAFQKIPGARKLFAKNIELQAKQFFGMFRWLITNLKQPDPRRLVKSIKILGAMHEKMNVKEEWYSLFLEAFHETMVETTKDTYIPRTRFCMEQLYTLVVNIMLNKDFESLSSAKISQFLKSLGSLEECLVDKQGSEYLEMYMRQQFCVEHILFYKEYRRFKGCVNDTQRQIIGSGILKDYLDDDAQCEINVSYCTKHNVYHTLKINHYVFKEHIFDECCKETIKLMKNNIWNEFKKSIFKMAVDADINYQANASSRSLKRYASMHSEHDDSTSRPYSKSMNQVH